LATLFINIFLGFLVLSMVYLLEIFYNLSGEPFILKDYYEISKNIFICLKIWAPILNKSSNEVYEIIYSLWLGTILNPIPDFQGQEVYK
jgi:hypothetical protein